MHYRLDSQHNHHHHSCAHSNSFPRKTACKSQVLYPEKLKDFHKSLQLEKKAAERGQENRIEQKMCALLENMVYENTGEFHGVVTEKQNDG